MTFGSILAPAFARRVARATRHRLPTPTVRTISTTPTLFAKSRSPRNVTPQTSIPTPTALSALLSRLSLPPNTTLHPVLVACLTHPSFTSQQSTLDFPAETSNEVESDLTELSEQITETNEILSSLGNSLLGLFASEHLSAQYPHLPATALKRAVTAYVGPKACMSVARELGLGTQNKLDDNFNGIGVRWRRLEVEQDMGAKREKTPIARRFERYQGAEKGHHRHEKKDTFEDVVAGVVKAFVGLIYRERGIHAAREFTHAHFMSRYLDMTSLFTFKNPKHVLSSVVTQHLAQAGVAHSEGVGKIESRVLASTGTNSQAPIFNIGLFLASGVKLAEGFGSSYQMAEHRASVNALLSMFLVRSESTSTTTSGLPTSIHSDWLLSAGQIASRKSEVFESKYSVEGETVVESGRSRR